MVLCLNGDVFDLWLGEFSYFKSAYKDLIDVLRKLGRKNVRLIYFQGNHDLYLEDFWGKSLGFEIYRHPQVLELMGQKFAVEHGDLMNPKDKGYLFLKSLLNNRGVEKAIKGLPEGVVRWVGGKMSSASRKLNPHSEELSGSIREMIRGYAKKRHQETGADFIVTGHVHVEDLWSAPEFTSVNLGSWHTSQKVLSWSPAQGFTWLEV